MYYYRARRSTHTTRTRLRKLAADTVSAGRGVGEKQQKWRAVAIASEKMAVDGSFRVGYTAQVDQRCRFYFFLH